MISQGQSFSKFSYLSTAFELKLFLQIGLQLIKYISVAIQTNQYVVGMHM